MAEDNEDDPQDAATDRQDAVLEAFGEALKRSWSGPGEFLGSKALRWGVKWGVEVKALRDARSLSKTSS